MKKLLLSLSLLLSCFAYAEKVTVHVKEAGTLSSYIDESQKYKITSLTITGQINGDDVDLIRNMAGGSLFSGYTNGKLEYLNIKEALVVQGGSYTTGGWTYSTSNLEIGSSMFAYLSKLRTIILPETTKRISSRAFTECNGLEEIVIPDNVFAISYESFAKCANLKTITIGENLSELSGGWNFSFCPKLKKFIVSEENEHFKSVDGILFSKDGKTLICYPNARSSNYNIPVDVTLGACSFAGCVDLEYIEIPEGTDYLEVGIFAFCTGLKSIKLPTTLKELSSEVFVGCTSLTSVTIPKDVYSINNSFVGCENLRTIYSMNPTPPYADFSYGVNIIECTVFVPKGSYKAYSKAEGWRYFLNIKEMDFSDIESIHSNRIYAENGMIIVESNEIHPIEVYSISGKLVKQTAPTGNISIAVCPGVYVVKAGKETKKIIVE
ncbi:leucine-rich repeat domain-containing protein [Parabacteroides sp. OttesenSCG-928-N08]|nr:leucine-rich repeat domain-containing protein [Parabacteroides sp. OttesenSCG-928-N08]